MKLASSLAPLVPILFTWACVAPSTGTDGPAAGGGSGDGVGGVVSAGGGSPPQGAGGSSLVVEDGTGGSVDPGSMPDCDSVLEVVFRDFNASHPDFEEVHAGQDDVGCGMVMPTLDTADGRRQPVFQASIGTGQRMIDEDGIITCITPWPYTPPGEITSAVTFADWYNDVPDVNMTIDATLDLTASGDTFVFDSAGTPGFFPLDGQGFDEQTQGHNFHFTTEAHVRFGYQSGQVFTFSGDDDLWIFVNDKLALDLGGLHSPLTATLDFDAQAAALGITPGNTYNMDIFHAERHTSASNFRIETNISCFTTVVVVR